MADVTLSIVFKDLKVALASQYFLKVKPNTERKVKAGVNPNDIPDGTPKTDDTYYEDAFPTTKLWAEEVLRRYMWKLIGQGYLKTQFEARQSISGTKGDYLG